MFRHLKDILLKMRNRHFLLVDIIVFLFTPAIALALHNDGLDTIFHYRSSLLVVTLAFMCTKMVLFYLTNVYRRYWRYAGVYELAHIIIVGLFALTVQEVMFLVLLRPSGLVPPDFPMTLPVIEGLLALMHLGGFRFSVRLAESMYNQTYDRQDPQRALIVGAGHAGVAIVKEMLSQPQLGLLPIGFIDDDVKKHRSIIQGVSVLGDSQDIPALIRETKAPLVIIAMPTASGKAIRAIVESCEQAHVKTKIIPGIYELLNGKVSVKQLRDVQIDDLLRRKPISTNTSAVAALIRGKRVLVTGAGGSIGSEISRQVLRCGPSELVLLGHGENSIFNIHNELQGWMQTNGAGLDSMLQPVIADIRMPERIEKVFEQYRPEIVLHAAAHKHVPLMEENPVEAITNNVLGTRNMLDAALAAGVVHFVMISTDKAVNPTSIMGASKRVAELLVHQAAQVSGRSFVTVRFGNVLGSRGSVVLTFKQQIAAGGPVTVTHPDMQRFFMTIPEAVQLTLQAATIGQGGEVFTLDMGDSVKIVDLARDMIELSGLEMGRDIDIVFTGMRPGEKLYEELFIEGENCQRTVHEKIFIGRNASDLVPMYLSQMINLLDIAAQQHDYALLWRTLQDLIPQFRAELVLNETQPALIGSLQARVVAGD